LDKWEEMIEARRSFTGELRWYRYNTKEVLQQKVLIEGTEDGVWVQKFEWADVKLVCDGGE